MIAQSVTGTPGHINSMATSMRHFLAQYPASTLEPGDVLMTNNPWFTSGQLHDLTIVTPVFHGGRLVAFFGNTCHAADIGGRGLSADAREVHEEGLYLPIVKLYRGGDANATCSGSSRRTFQSPRWSSATSTHSASTKSEVMRLCSSSWTSSVSTASAARGGDLDRSERAMREAISRVPDGCLHRRNLGDGFAGDDPIHIVCTVTVDGGALPSITQAPRRNAGSESTSS